MVDSYIHPFYVKPRMKRIIELFHNNGIENTVLDDGDVVDDKIIKVILGGKRVFIEKSDPISVRPKSSLHGGKDFIVNYKCRITGKHSKYSVDNETLHTDTDGIRI